MNNHIFEGNLITCLKCFKSKSDPIHICFWNAGVANTQICPVTLYDSSNKPIHPTCAGHTCPSCKKTWNHSYDCGKVDSHGLCMDCAQQTAAEINRPSHILEIANGKNFRQLSGLEQQTLLLDHEQFVVLNIIRLPDGSENPEWQVKLSEHIQQLERMIEQYKIKVASSYKARAAKEVQDLNKLTPEEKEQFLKDASRNRIPKVREPKEKDVPLTGTKKEKAILSLLKMLHKQDTPENRKLACTIAGIPYKEDA